MALLNHITLLQWHCNAIAMNFKKHCNGVDNDKIHRQQT